MAMTTTKTKLKTAARKIETLKGAGQELLSQGAELGVDIKDSATDMVSASLHTGRNLWLASLGAVAETGEKSQQVFDNLVAKGETFQKKQRKAVDKTLDRTFSEVEARGKKARQWVDRRIEATVDGAAGTFGGGLERFGVPTRDDIKSLTLRVEQLTAKVESLAAAN